MGIGKFCLEEKLEVWIKGQVLTSKLENFAFSLFNERSCENGHQDSINTVTNVFNHSWISMFNGDLKFSINSFWTQPQALQFIFFFFFSNPWNTLELGINHQGISLTVCQNCTIFNWHLIRWKDLFVPFSCCCFISEQLDRIHVQTHWNFVCFKVLFEIFLYHDVSESFVEGPSIGYKGRWHQNVTNNDLNLFIQNNYWLTPPFILTS